MVENFCNNNLINNAQEEEEEEQNFPMALIAVNGMMIPKKKIKIFKYKFLNHIRRNANGCVDLVTEEKTGKLYAMKIDQIVPDDISAIKKYDEIKFLLGLKIPTILELKDYKIEYINFYIILEYAELGTLSNFIKESKKNNTNLKKNRF